MPRSPARRLSSVAIRSTCSADSITHGPAMKARGSPRPTPRPRASATDKGPSLTGVRLGPLGDIGGLAGRLRPVLAHTPGLVLERGLDECHEQGMRRER